MILHDVTITLHTYTILKSAVWNHPQHWTSIRLKKTLVQILYYKHQEYQCLGGLDLRGICQYYSERLIRLTKGHMKVWSDVITIFKEQSICSHLPHMWTMVLMPIQNSTKLKFIVLLKSTIHFVCPD